LRAMSARKRILRRVAAGAGLLCVPIAALAYLQPTFQQPPVPVSVREDSGQLVARWPAQFAAEPGRLEIGDAIGRTGIHPLAGQSSVTYAHRSGDVEFFLSTAPREGSARWQGEAHIPADPPKPSVDLTASDDLADLEHEVTLLRTSAASGKAVVRTL